MRKAMILWAWLLLGVPCFAQNSAESKPNAAGMISQAAGAVKALAGESAPLEPFVLAQRILLVPGVSLSDVVELKQNLSQAHLDQASALLNEHLDATPDDELALLLLAHAKWEPIARTLHSAEASGVIDSVDTDCVPLLEQLLDFEKPAPEAVALAATIFFERGMLLKNTDQLEAAATSFELVGALQPLNLEAVEALAQLRMQTADTAQAIEQYQRAIEASPEPRFYLPLLTLLEADPLQAELLARTWEAFLTDCPEHPEALLANGSRLYDAGSFRSALEVLSRCLEAVPDDARVLRMMGNCHWSLGDYPAAAVAFETALAQDYDPLLVANLAGAYSNNGDEQSATALWRKYARLRPDDSVLAMQYGLALFDAQNYRGALEQYLRGQKLEPGNDLFFNRAGLCLFHLGDFAIAAKQVKQALERKADPLYYNNLAIAYENSGEPALAAQYYSQGLELFPSDTGLLENYTAFLLSTGEGDVALAQLQQAAQAANHPDLYIRLADLATTQGEFGIADNAYAEAIQLRPDEPWPMLTYALFLAGLNRTGELAEHLRLASGRLSTEDFSWIVDELGSYWADSKKYSQGASFMGSLTQVISTEPKVYTTWALLLSLDGDSNAALEAVRAGLRQAGETYSARYLETMLASQIEGPAAALTLAEKLVTMPGVDASGFLLVLDLQDELGATQQSVETARQALIAFPVSQEIFSRLAYAYYFSGANREVVSLLEDQNYMRLGFQDRDNLLGLGYLETGNYVKSAGYFLAATEAEPQNPELWARLGEALFFKAEYAQAKESLDTALKLDPGLVEGRLWLGLVLLELGQSTEADQQFKAVETSPYSPPMALAWTALGRGRLALTDGRLEDARLLLDEAKAYGAGVARFDLELEKTRRKTGRF